MKQKDLEALAAKLYQSRPYLPTGDDAVALTSNELAFRRGQHAAWVGAVIALADVLSTASPRFNRARFFRACGVEVE